MRIRCSIALRTFGLGGLVVLTACGGGAPATDAAVCAPAGRWRAEEHRNADDCAPELAPEESLVIELSELDMTDRQDSWRLRITRGPTPLTSCSGVPSDDHCRLEFTCSRGVDEERGSYALTLELSETGMLGGSSVLTFPDERGETCQARFGLDGKKVGPLESESVREPS